MRMFKKGPFSLWIEALGSGTETRFINRLFSLSARARRSRLHTAAPSCGA
jgi:hypothetical protein